MANAVVGGAQAGSQKAKSVTATICYHSLATAMSRMSYDSANNLEKGTVMENSSVMRYRGSRPMHAVLG